MMQGLIIILLFISSVCNGFEISDSIMYNLEWLGPSPEDLDPSNKPHIFVTSKENEKYCCILPSVIDSSDTEDHQSYVGPTELELLKSLFDQNTCSFRIENYWIYELCHGKYLRQYHEEKDSVKQKVSLQEYYLGYYKKESAQNEDAGKDTEKDKEENPAQSVNTMKSKAPTQKVEGLDIPYYKVSLTDGTHCDLTGNPRITHLHYVCQREGRGEIYEMKETSTCEYIVVVLSKELCKHPLYELKNDPINHIQCHSIGDAPTRPKSLVNQDIENRQARFNKKESSSSQTLPKKDKTYGQRTVVKTSTSIPVAAEVSATTKEPSSVPEVKYSQLTDKKLIQDFLKGEHCVKGGTGWWKHEFCYGKHVIQYHEEKGQKTVVSLGKWSQEGHMEWLKKYPYKYAKKTEVFVTHFYGRGDICDITGKPRFTEVKLKCKGVHSTKSPNAISLYLVEPKTCEYALVVESNIICQLLENVDETMLLSAPPL